MSRESPDLLTSEEVCKRWRDRVTPRTLEKWRQGVEKTGPPFVRLYKGGPVLYPLAGILEYERKNLHLANKEKSS